MVVLVAPFANPRTCTSRTAPWVLERKVRRIPLALTLVAIHLLVLAGSAVVVAAM